MKTELAILTALVIGLAGCKSASSYNYAQPRVSNQQTNGCVDPDGNYVDCAQQSAPMQAGYGSPQHVYIPHPVPVYHSGFHSYAADPSTRYRVTQQPRVMVRPTYHMVSPTRVYVSRPSFSSSRVFRSSGFRSGGRR
jgi:hypothetical protein